MRAIRQHEFGPAENLLYEQVPDPEPGQGEVAIAVEAAGVHLLDTSIRKGAPDLPVARPELPMTPGREVAGTVDAVGPGVDAAWVGRRVTAHLGRTPIHGGYAERTVAAVDSLHAIPDGLDAATAVAAIGTGRTAVLVLDVAQIEADDVVLITSAAGGMGSLFVQAVGNAGAVAVGVAGGTDKVRRVSESGAAVAVDYLAPDWPEQVRSALGDREVTLVLDGVGGDTGRAAFDLLGVGGRIVMFGYSSGQPIAITTQDIMERSLTVSWGIGQRLMKPGALRSYETRALEEAAAGRLVPVVQTFPLADAAKAHAALESRETVGKVVLVP